MRRNSWKFLCGALIGTALVLATPSSLPALSADHDGTITARTFSNLSKQVLPSVVSIEVERTIADSHPRLRGRNQEELEDFLRKFFGQVPEGMVPPNMQPPGEEEDLTYKSAGSGFFFFVDGSTGYVMTNNHVIDDAKDGDIAIILDTTYNDLEIKGDKVQIVGRDTLGDLAVLKVDLGETQVKAIEWGDSEEIEIGEWVLALGNPLELRNSVTQGIVSAKHRRINKTGIEDLLQTTASINPGNSGGPLVNLDGEVIGINNAIATRTGMWAGVAFAIPSSYARTIADQIQKTGKIAWGYLGIQMADLTEEMAKYFDLDTDQGVIVQNVNAGTAAEKAGLKPYDIIVKIDGKSVKDSGDMLRMIATKSVGSEVNLTILRKPEDGGKSEETTLTAVLGERPTEEELSSIMGGPALQRNLSNNYGLTFDAQTPDSEGLTIKSVDPGSLAAKAGLRAGDTIVQVNREDVKTPDDFAAALKKRPEGKEDHLIMYSRGGMNGFTTMQAAK